MRHTVTATKKDGIYTYFLNGTEFLRDLKRYTYATIYVKVHPSPLNGESIWAIPTTTDRRAVRKHITAEGGEFEGVVKIQEISQS
jgi:hypothetical protein